jgi:hypothetical protein
MFLPALFALALLTAIAIGLVVALAMFVRGQWVKAICVVVVVLLVGAAFGISGLRAAAARRPSVVTLPGSQRCVVAPPALPGSAPAALATPGRAEAGDVRIDIHSGAPVVSFAIPAECKRGIKSGCLELQRDIWESLAEFSRDVHATDKEVETLQRRLRSANLWELAERLLDNLEARGLIRIESDGWETSADDGQRIPPTAAQASFRADEIRVLLDGMRAGVPRRAAGSRPVMLSTLVVIVIVVIAYYLLKGGLRHAAATRSRASRPHH